MTEPHSLMFCILTQFNTLTPKIDWHLISPYNYHSQISQWGHESTENDHWRKKLLIIQQILLVSTLGSV